MAICPQCHTEIERPVKIWSIRSGRSSRGGAKERFMGIFECQSCNTRFRAAAEPLKIQERDTASVKNMVERIKNIKGELMQTLKGLRAKIKTLETERSNLMIEIEKLKEMAESKVSALEGEVSMLRDEVESLRDLLGYEQLSDA